MKETIIIKRYSNRKLYNTHNSNYVTLDELSKMIKNGDDIRVICNSSRTDITASTLSQVVFDKERTLQNKPSVGLLNEIIRDGDGSFSGYMQVKMATELARFDK